MMSKNNPSKEGHPRTGTIAAVLPLNENDLEIPE